MTRILVIADRPDGAETALVLEERVVPGDLTSDQVCARLVERVGWALVDADEIERRTPSPRARLAAVAVKRGSEETRPLRAA